MNKTLLSILLLSFLSGGTALAADGDKKGDANGDGLIDVTDATIVIDKYHNISTPSFPKNADVNGDLVIDVTDSTIILDLFHYGVFDGSTIITPWIDGDDVDVDLEFGD